MISVKFNRSEFENLYEWMIKIKVFKKYSPNKKFGDFEKENILTWFEGQSLDTTTFMNIEFIERRIYATFSGIFPPPATPIFVERFLKMKFQEYRIL